MYPAVVKPPIIVNVHAYANDALMGKIIADYFVSDSGGKGNAVIEHVPGVSDPRRLHEWIPSEVKALCPRARSTLANITIPDLVAGKTPSTLVSALQSNPSANYLVFDDGPFADGRRLGAVGGRLSHPRSSARRQIRPASRR